MTPMAPDASRENDRTIILFYDGCQQAVVAQKLEPLDRGEQRRRIMLCRDGHPYDSEIRTLESWGVAVDEVMPNIPRPPFNQRKYWLHDTPRVRAIIDRIDEERPHDRALNVRDVVKSQPKSSDYVLCALVTMPNGDCEWKEIHDVVSRPKSSLVKNGPASS